MLATPSFPSAHCDEHAAPQSLVRLAIVVAIARLVCLVFGVGLVALVSVITFVGIDTSVGVVASDSIVALVSNVALVTLSLLLPFRTTASITRYPARSTQAHFEVARDSRDPAARWRETQRSTVTANGHAGIESNEPQRSNRPTVMPHPKEPRMCPVAVGGRAVVNTLDTSPHSVTGIPVRIA